EVDLQRLLKVRPGRERAALTHQIAQGEVAIGGLSLGQVYRVVEADAPPTGQPLPGCRAWSKRSAMSKSGRISDVVIIPPALTIGLCGKPLGLSASSLNDCPLGSRPTWRCTASTPCSSNARQ